MNFSPFLHDGGLAVLFAQGNLDNFSTGSSDDGFFFFAKVTHVRHFCVFRTCLGFPGQVPIFQPSSAHRCERSRAPGVPESPGVLLPGDSAPGLPITAPMSLIWTHC